MVDINWHKLAWIALALAFVIVQVALIAAKVTGHIHCSWLWILAPLWSPFLALAVAVIILIAALGNDTANGGNPFQ